MWMKTLNLFLLADIIAINAKTIERKDQRIVGGEPAPAGRFPYYAHFDPFDCGATLIHSDIVLGAAHCCPVLQCGLLFDSIALGEGTSATVETYVVHPQYNDPTSENDVMIMKLTAPLDITPIGYNTQSSVPADNDELTVIGFGRTSSGGPVSDDLLQVTVNYVPNDECNDDYNPGGAIITDDMLCAAAAGKDACQGDSGGPIFNADDGTGDIVGVVSWGFGCADPLYPGVYARTSYFIEWHEEAICCMSDDPPDSCETNTCSAEFGVVTTCGDTSCPTQPTDNRSDEDGILETVTESVNEVVNSTPNICLSPDATALVETKGKVSIKDVAVGDKVMTASGEYKSVFTISHFHPDQLTSFLSVQTEMKENPLELTPLHMLFLQGKQTPVPAKDVNIGDVVQTLYDGPQKVTNITVVTKKGFYNPLTMDGTIVVDGIIVSTYASLNGGSYLEIAGTKWISFHLLLDMIASPFRAFCTTLSLDFCARYQPSTVRSMMQFYEFWSKQNNAAQFVLLFVVVLFFGLTRIMFSSAAGSLAILAFVGMICHRMSTKISVLHKKKCYVKKLKGT